MPFHFLPNYLFQSLFRKRVNQFFLSMALRSFAIGMVFIFEPVYIFKFFHGSILMTLLFFGAVHLLYGLLVVWGGKIMARLGFAYSIFFSHLFFAGYYLTLEFLNLSFLMVFLALFLNILSRLFFWPSFHTEFVRFSSHQERGNEVGKMNAALIFPAILAPAVGGWILKEFGFATLFVSVFCVLIVSTLPLFFVKAKREHYIDNFETSVKRIFKKENLRVSAGLFFLSIEVGVAYYFWPIFMMLIALGYFSMGAITSFAILVTTVFMIYIGNLSNQTSRRERLIEMGSWLTALSWVLKFFVFGGASALIADSFYRICRAALGVPFQTFFYERASAKKSLADEFIVSREMVINIAKPIAFLIIGLIYIIWPNIRISFLVASLSVLGLKFTFDNPEKLFSLFGSDKKEDKNKNAVKAVD